MVEEMVDNDSLVCFLMSAIEVSCSWYLSLSLVICSALSLARVTGPSAMTLNGSTKMLENIRNRRKGQRIQEKEERKESDR